jgi:hypothetical protein
MTGPIIFSHETAQRQLREEGIVTTFRAQKRTTGDTWWRETRTGPKQGDVTVTLLEAGDPYQGGLLSRYYEKSGFETPAEWREAIGIVNGVVPSEGYVYEVVARGE